MTMYQPCKGTVMRERMRLLVSQYLGYQNSGHEGEDEEDCEDPTAGGVRGPLVQHHLVRLQTGGEGRVRYEEKVCYLS